MKTSCSWLPPEKEHGRDIEIRQFLFGFQFVINKCFLNLKSYGCTLSMPSLWPSEIGAHLGRSSSPGSDGYISHVHRVRAFD